ncbi:hypothetical protein FOPG_18962 [Fusarium oxysporum f. sp. conglutinans race 2 54008]|uniref:PD-(D/E)XK nuclease-like domain-containing protein n=1 Tax=Fusarium oxysporum f. sp. conglutinans race 2 54008 TaxID=1089457 RepID=X0GMG7_FUSOX|nr:hypothetical protein FOPG_18962 [Fusarium oxysporum f. sp. conglutinans race 2 54008]KAG7000748.1 hypothetical protein FocnCong_v013440 [Fusarium oxysporum f. sp. conglutinans]KAH7187714.1 hypothetical protein DER44DRAFT_799236 [Fusarium oxysporum]KAI8417326.1 hypothetical protein FOFC_03639 [Fusarium oxysporum]
MPTSSVLKWLDEISTKAPISNHHHDREDAGQAKRRRLNPPTPDPSIAPKMSVSTTRETSPGKRKGQNDPGTPRSKRSRDLLSEVDLPPSEVSVAGSGRLSPSKQFQLLRLQPGGPDFGDLSQFVNKPEKLQSLLTKLDDVMEGFDIISASQQSHVQAAPSLYNDEFDWAKSQTRTHYYSKARDELGPTPTVEFIMDILDAAANCNSQQQHEDAWNKFVHTPILKFAFHQKGQRISKQLINCSSCINAAIIPEYQVRTPGTSKKVDFCIHVNPINDTNSASSSLAAMAIRRLMLQLPGNVFNFTNFLPLQDQPIALSIETKRPTEGFDVAKLQLGVWQAAHWTFLNTLIHTQQENGHIKQLQAQVEAQSLDSTQESTEQLFCEVPPQQRQSDIQPLGAQQEVDPRFKPPEFLPGVIINGHEWWLTVTTLEESRVKFYEKVALGSTKGTKDIYKLICSLQVLRQWIDTTYWPWLRELIVDC